MKKDFIENIVEIGRRGVCTDEELPYFLNNSSYFSGRDILPILRKRYGISTTSMGRREILEVKPTARTQVLSEKDEALVSFIVNLIKGIHIIEFKSGYGGGSPSIICNLFRTLIKKDPNRYIELYNWIVSNGGNYYFNTNLNFAEAKIDEERRGIWRKSEKERIKKIHFEAEERKNDNRDGHLLRSKKQNKKRTDKINELAQLDNPQQFKSLIKSNYPLDFYPAKFSKISENDLKKIPKNILNKFLTKTKRMRDKKHKHWIDLRNKILKLK